MTFTHIDRFYRLIKKFSFHLHHLFGPACTNVTMTQKLDYLFRAIQKYTNTTIPTTSHYNNVIQEILTLIPSTHSLREKCSNTEVFRVRIFLYSDWIQGNTDQKNFHIWTLFTQWLCNISNNELFLQLWSLLLKCIWLRKPILLQITEKSFV